MNFLHIAGIAAALVGAQMSASAATFEALSAPGFTTETTSAANQYLMPAAPAGSTVASYSVLSTASGFSNTATLSFAAPVTSFSFLWGSPDSYESVTDGTVTYTGSNVSSGTGNNAESLLFTFSDPLGFSSLTFSASGVAFEIAAVAAPVPEPSIYGLMLGGLGIMGFLAVRRRRD